MWKDKFGIVPNLLMLPSPVLHGKSAIKISDETFVDENQLWYKCPEADYKSVNL